MESLQRKPLRSLGEDVDQYGIPTDEAKDQKEFEALVDEGAKVEQEHKGTLTKLIKKIDPNIPEDKLKELLEFGYRGIASDHINELNNYYEHLAEIEALAKE